MRKMKSTIGGVVFFIIAILIVQVMFYSKNLKLISAQPSSTWAKGVDVYEGAINKELDIIERDDGVYIAFLEDEDIKVLKLDKDGKVIKEAIIEVENRLWNLVLFEKKSTINIAWCEKSEKISNVIIREIDNDLKVGNSIVVEGSNSIDKMSRRSILISGNGEFYINNNIKLIKSGEISTFDGVEQNGKEYVLYKDLNTDEYKVDIFEKSEFVESIVMGTVPSMSSVGNHNQTLLVSETEINVVFERFTKGNFSDTKLLSYNIGRKEVKKANLYVDGDRVFALERSGDKGYVMGVIGRSLDKRIDRRDIIEFKIEGMKYSDKRIVTNTGEKSLFARRSGNYILYGDSTGYNKVKLKITSKNETFKDMTNKISSADKKRAAMITFKGIGMTFANLFIIGYAWLLPSVLILAITFFFNEKLSLRGKKIVFVICSLLIIGSELMIAYGTFYEKFGFKLPNVLSMRVGLFIVFISFIVTLAKPYDKYINDDEEIPMSNFIGRLILQSIFVLSIFSPYISNI